MEFIKDINHFNYLDNLKGIRLENAKKISVLSHHHLYNEIKIAACVKEFMMEAKPDDTLSVVNGNINLRTHSYAECINYHNIMLKRFEILKQ